MAENSLQLMLCMLMLEDIMLKNKRVPVVLGYYFTLLFKEFGIQLVK